MRIAFIAWRGLVATMPLNSRRLDRPAQSISGFSLIELLVVLGVIAVLLAILMPTVSLARRSAKATHCSANLRSIGQALTNYAIANRDWVPRDNNPYGEIAIRSPFMAVVRLLSLRDAMDESGMHRIDILRCQMHPLVDSELVPTTYVSNAMPNIPGRQPIPHHITTLASRLSAVRHASAVIFIAEARDRFDIGPVQNDLINRIFTHDVWDEHLIKMRITGNRHGSFSNALMFDGSVTRYDPTSMAFANFDDGMRDGSAGRILFRSPN